MKIYILHSI